MNPEMRKRLKRYETEGVAGLESRRAIRSPAKKVFKKHEKWSIGFRENQKPGPRRIRSELIWRRRWKVSLATIHQGFEDIPGQTAGQV